MQPSAAHGEHMALSAGRFREFANLNSSSKTAIRRNIRKFADEHGDILAQLYESIDRVARKLATLETWCRSIQHMERAVQLWGFLEGDKRFDIELRFIRRKTSIDYLREPSPVEATLRKLGPPKPDFLTLVTAENASLPTLVREALRLEINDALIDVSTPSHTTFRLNTQG